jgi:predicted nucleic acid-binding protein
MLYYLDSSACMKRYAPERGSWWVKSLAEPKAGHTVYLAQIAIVEIAAGLSKKVRTRELTLIDYAKALDVFLCEVRSGLYQTVPLTDTVVEMAVDLTRRHPLRGYDAVHLATAMALNSAVAAAALPAVVFVASDEALCKAARAEGLFSENPILK